MTEGFAQYFDRFGIRHFAAREFLVSTNRPGNTLPPEFMWPNIVPTALVLDELRAHFDSPIVVTSCYRAPDYNRQVGGTPRSNHQAFTAADFGVAGVSPAEVAEFLRSWRGRWFRAPERIPRVPVEVPVDDPDADGDARKIPFAELEWRESDGVVEFQLAAAVGEYARFTHLDTRGTNNSWSGH